MQSSVKTIFFLNIISIICMIIGLFFVISYIHVGFTRFTSFNKSNKLFNATYSSNDGQ